MTSVISGDIINSRKREDTSFWLKSLKAIFLTIGKNPETWQIYKGDYFQIEIENIFEVVIIAFKIKAAIKMYPSLDVRMSIGIGEKNFSAKQIGESNGQAFVFSGEELEKLKKNTLVIKSPWNDLDEQMNLYFSLLSLTMNNWTVSSAEIVDLTLKNPALTQTELSKKLNITQGRVSERQKRAALDELLKVEKRFRHILKEKTG
jgi:hypothetical protein